MQPVLLDATGHRRSRATMPGYNRGCPPRNKDERYTADLLTVEEIVAVMRSATDRAHGQRLRALIILLWRAGLRVGEALALQESDLDPTRGVSHDLRRVEGALSTSLAAHRGTGIRWLLRHRRFGCGGDRLQGRQVPAQGPASWVGEGDLSPRA